MVSDVFYNDFQASINRMESMPAIMQALASYGLTLPAHDPKTGLIASGDVAKLLAAVRGVDATAHRSGHAEEILRLLQHAGLAA